jgi:hypothetical protein
MDALSGIYLPACDADWRRALFYFQAEQSIMILQAALAVPGGAGAGGYGD